MTEQLLFQIEPIEVNQDKPQIKKTPKPKEEISEFEFPVKELRRVRTERRFCKWAKFWHRKNFSRLENAISFTFQGDLEFDFVHSVLLPLLGNWHWENAPDLYIHKIIARIKHWRKWLRECEAWREAKIYNPDIETPSPEFEPDCYYYKCNEVVYE